MTATTFFETLKLSLRRCNLAVLTISIALQLLFSAESWAQHAIDVQRLHADGSFLESLIEYGKIPRRRVTIDAVIAAGKSAWALGLPERALAEFDTALRLKGLDILQRAELLLSQGIIHLQEDELEVANHYAEKVSSSVGGGHVLRARALLLSAEALSRLGRPAEAERRYQEALDESPENDTHNALFGLGETRLKLGKIAEARNAFEAIPTESDHAAEAVRKLAELEMIDRNHRRAFQWLIKGQQEHTTFFLDSWVQYALVRCAVSMGDVTLVNDLRRVANERFPGSDGWVSLLNAEAESFVWSNAREQSSH
jgi:tetratricopeptide (TPR) repeat protein